MTKYLYYSFIVLIITLVVACEDDLTEPEEQTVFCNPADENGSYTIPGSIPFSPSTVPEFTKADVPQNSQIDGATVMAKLDVSTGKWEVADEYTSRFLSMAQLWTSFQNIVPQSRYQPRLQTLYIFGDKDVEVLGYAQHETDDLSQWSIGLYDVPFTDYNTLVGGYRIFVHTVAHEFFHLQSLDQSQLDPSTASASCDGVYADGLGCAKPSSYLLAFYNKFWKEGNKDPNISATYDPEAFVSRYASTNIREDIAESFANFVFLSRPTSADLVRCAKVDFFYDYAELVSIRTEIRKNFEKFGLENDRLIPDQQPASKGKARLSYRFYGLQRCGHSH